MKIKILISLCLMCNLLWAQRTTEIKKIKSEIVSSENSIYIYCRGTKSKSALIAHTFNYSDTNITHVGIGYKENNKLQIYNVSDMHSQKESALFIDTLESYLSSKDVYYFSIWEYQTSKIEISRFKKILKSYLKKDIIFDALFNLKKNDSLYCSEFCVNVLSELNKTKFDFNPNNYVLKNPIFEAFLNRKILTYFPVDFFRKSILFKKIYYSKLSK